MLVPHPLLGCYTPFVVCLCHTPFSPAVEQVQEKVMEMTLEEGKPPVPLVSPSVPLVGGKEEDDEHSDTDSEPAVDIDEYQEEEDPVSV